MSSPPALPAFDGTLGIVQIGLVVATWLFGVETLQTFNYFQIFEKDGKLMKGLVPLDSRSGLIHTYLVLPDNRLLELGSTIACWHSMYSITVTFYGRPQHILSPPISLIFAIPLNVFIAVLVQTFFAYRVKVLSGRSHILILTCIVNAARLGFNLHLFGTLLENPVFSLLTTKFSWEITVVSTFPLAVDMLIAASLLYSLWTRRTTQFKHTNRVVDTLIMWTVETTLLTTTSGAMQLILFLARRHDCKSSLELSCLFAYDVAVSWLFFFLLQGRLFSNSLMASLNGRARLRNPDVLVNQSSNATSLTHSNVVIRMHNQTSTAYDTTTMGKPEEL
ncbi:Saposin B-type domain-containing protein [Favolaschia claudopus]|uniref:Saposin B-type domain-containing protein n=1 Tax=Favolaschia claudopus TaxID=2862362 RepID=A0AAW0EEZ8_9AGAR